ncbi:MAG: DUF3422 family protein [bacterium]
MTMPPLHRQHPDRAAIQAEAHARPPVAIATKDSQAWHWVLCDANQAAQSWPDIFDPTARHQLIETADGLLRFERHTEFISLTYFGPAKPSAQTLEVIRRCPGEQIAGAKVILAEELSFSDIFGQAFFGGNVMFDNIAVATDFQVAENGLVTYAVSGHFEDGAARGRLVKRLLDLETYRMASMLGLPLTRRLTPTLEELEKRSQIATRSLTENEGPLNKAILELSDILKEVSAIRSDAFYRIAASKAYFDLVVDRLKSLGERQIDQRQTIGSFVKHRLDPGMKSIRAFERRTRNIATAVSEALALVRTQLDHSAQQQSQALLASMEKRARQQLQLSQAVEGLSVAAITYYTISLLAYILKGLPDFTIDDKMIIAAAILPVTAIVAFVTQRAKRHISNLPKH